MKFIIFYLFTNVVCAQNKTIETVNSIDSLNVPFVYVYSNNKLIGKTNIVGIINIADTINNVELRHPDFYTYKIEDLQTNILYLKPLGETLDEIVISKPKSIISKNIITKGAKFTVFPINDLEIIAKITPKTKEVNKKIHSISFPCSYNSLINDNLGTYENNEAEYSYRLTIYNFNREYIFSKFISISVNEAKSIDKLIFKIDKELLLTDKGLFIGFEFLGRSDKKSNLFTDNYSNLYFTFNLMDKEVYYVTKFNRQNNWKVLKDVYNELFKDYYDNFPRGSFGLNELINFSPYMEIELY